MSVGVCAYIQLLKAVKAASMEALAMEKRVAVLRGVFLQAHASVRGTHVHVCNA